MIRKLQTQKSVSSLPDWPGPVVVDTAAPKISSDRYRRYMEYQSSKTATAATTTTILSQRFDYPSIVRQVTALVEGAACTNDEIILEADGVQIFDLSIYTMLNMQNQDTHYIDQLTTFTNPAAGTPETGTIKHSDPTINYTAKAPPAFFTVCFDTTAHDWALACIKVDSFIEKEFTIKLKNVQAAQNDTVELVLVTDRPIESQYTSSSDQS